jgi:hypothetical protein
MPSPALVPVVTAYFRLGAALLCKRARGYHVLPTKLDTSPLLPVSLSYDTKERTTFDSVDYEPMLRPYTLSSS